VRLRTAGSTRPGSARAEGTKAESTRQGGTTSAPAVGPTVHTTIDSPLGVLTLVALARGASGGGTDDGAATGAAALTGVYLPDQRHRPAPERFGSRVDAADVLVLLETARQLGEYFAGAREGFDLPLASWGTSFQQAVRAELLRVPFGATTSYGRIAADLAERGTATSGASRAVGAAVGRNPLSIVVPCHRVVASDGGLTGYAGGLERKVWLLTHEGVLV